MAKWNRSFFKARCVAADGVLQQPAWVPEASKITHSDVEVNDREEMEGDIRFKFAKLIRTLKPSVISPSGWAPHFQRLLRGIELRLSRFTESDRARSTNALRREKIEPRALGYRRCGWPRRSHGSRARWERQWWLLRRVLLAGKSPRLRNEKSTRCRGEEWDWWSADVNPHRWRWTRQEEG